MAIFKCFDDPKVGPFLTVHGITDDDLIRYIVARANGTSAQQALDSLVKGRFATQGDVDYMRRIVEQFPIPTANVKH
jgi:predicted HAD superfamily phosphohydrolase